MSEDKSVAPVADRHKPRGGYVEFAVKVLIVTFAVALGLGYVFDSIVGTLVNTENLQMVTTALRASLEDEKTRVRLKGLLTTNPAVHYRVSAIEEGKGNFGAAIEEIELALGLLELHSADRATREKYQARLQELMRMQAAQSGSAAKR